MNYRTSPWLVTLCLPLVLAPAGLSAQRGQPVENNPEAAPIYRALKRLGADVQVFNQHLVTLANPFMEGRVPGSRGMEIAREYLEYYLKQAGTLPPWTDESGKQSYRQPFPVSSRQKKVTAQELSCGDIAFVPDRDFTVLGLSASAEATGNVVFVGYGVERGEDDYTSFVGDEDLEGKVAMVLRHEPMDQNGKSKWATQSRPWTRNSSLLTKVRNLLRRDAAGIIIVNVPGAADPRAAQLTKPGQGGSYSRNRDVPVLHMSTAAADQLLAEIAAKGTTVASLRDQANEGGGVVDFETGVAIRATLETQRIIAENVGGVVAGKGALKDEWVVIGGHLDHLGIGLYGARDRKRVGQLHPGADDNASGAAAILMLADRLQKDYSAMPADAAARSILLVGFDAEEAGLWGSRYYVENPLAPLNKHALMINFDMIGRIVNKRLSVSGVDSAAGMKAWLQPLFKESGLEIVQSYSGPGGSDHLPFMGKRVPYLFAIIKDFHMDYHTPDDVSWKINNEDAVHTVHLFHKIGLYAATLNESFTWQGRQGRRRGR